MRNIKSILLILLLSLQSSVYAQDWFLGGDAVTEVGILDFEESDEPDVSEIDGARMYYDETLAKLRCSEASGNFVDCVTKGITDNAPDTPSDTCEVSDAAHGSGYFYVCVATDTWKRVTLATWATSSYLLKIDGTYNLRIDGTNSLRIQ